MSALRAIGEDGRLRFTALVSLSQLFDSGLERLCNEVIEDAVLETGRLEEVWVRVVGHEAGCERERGKLLLEVSGVVVDPD